MKIVRLATVVLGLAFCVWIYFAPHLTVRSMRLAAERGDAGTLAAHVDFPALRQDLKSQFALAAADRIGGDGSGGWRDFGAALATAAAVPAIDAMVSEQGLMLMFTGRSLARDGLAAVYADDPTGRRASGAIDMQQWKAAAGYKNPSTFVVTLQPQSDSAIPAKLIFKRYRLLWWKLSGIELPPVGTDDTRAP
jgi:hypothetical protein